MPVTTTRLRMTQRFITGAPKGERARLALFVGLVAWGAVQPARAGAQPGISVATDGDYEVPLAPETSLPLFGPRYAKVTLELYVPFGVPLAHQMLGLVLRVFRDLQKGPGLDGDGAELRLRVVPVPVGSLPPPFFAGSSLPWGNNPAQLGSVAVRGAELVLEAFAQGSERCEAMLELLAQHPDWLEPGLETEGQLFAAAEARGLDIERLRRALRRHSRESRIQSMWLAEGDQARTVPELLINGHRLRGFVQESTIREEIDRQRSLAHQALRAGTPLPLLYEHLTQRERSEQPEVRTRPPFGRAGMFGLLSSATPEPLLPGDGREPLRMDLTGVPRRGPAISPVSLVLVGAFDTYTTQNLARLAIEVYARRSESIKLYFVQTPQMESSWKIAQLFAQVAMSAPDKYWKFFDAAAEYTRRRGYVRYNDFLRVASGERIDPNSLDVRLESPLTRERVEKDLAQARRVRLDKTPTLLLNHRPVRAMSVDQLEQLVQKELDTGVLERLLGPGHRAGPGLGAGTSPR